MAEKLRILPWSQAYIQEINGLKLTHNANTHAVRPGIRSALKSYKQSRLQSGLLCRTHRVFEDWVAKLVHDAHSEQHDHKKIPLHRPSERYIDRAAINSISP